MNMNKKQWESELVRIIYGYPNAVDQSLPKKNCAECFYRQIGMRDGGHCHMFREDFESKHCGQFKVIDGRYA